MRSDDVPDDFDARVESANSPHVFGARLSNAPPAACPHHQHPASTCMPVGSWRNLTAAEVAGLLLGACASGDQLARSDFGIDAVGPTPAIGRAPLRVARACGQPAKKVRALAGPVGVTEEHAAGARFHGEAPAEPKTRQAARAFDARRILGECELIGAHLARCRAPALTENSRYSVAMRGSAQCRAPACRRHIERSPGAAEVVPLEHHAVTTEI